MLTCMLSQEKSKESYDLSCAYHVESVSSQVLRNYRGDQGDSPFCFGIVWKVPGRQKKQKTLLASLGCSDITSRFYWDASCLDCNRAGVIKCKLQRGWGKCWKVRRASREQWWIRSQIYTMSMRVILGGVRGSLCQSEEGGRLQFKDRPCPHGLHSDVL